MSDLPTAPLSGSRKGRWFASFHLWQKGEPPQRRLGQGDSTLDGQPSLKAQLMEETSSNIIMKAEALAQTKKDVFQ